MINLVLVRVAFCPITSHTILWIHFLEQHIPKCFIPYVRAVSEEQSTASYDMISGIVIRDEITPHVHSGLREKIAYVDEDIVDMRS